jgi:Na+-transporting methylmalonyl-CoA/oxaloacetate decarboxylase beta subunit
MYRPPDIGIIGSADGPTSIVVSSGMAWYEIAALALGAVTVAAFIIWAVVKLKRRT